MVRFVEDGGDDSPIAPVIPLFGEQGPRPSRPGATAPRNRSGREDRASSDEAQEVSEPETAAVPDVGAAERILVRRLQRRGLSIREAHEVLRGEGMTSEQADEIIADFVERRYLDDARLAEQLVSAAVERRGHGRRLIAQSLSKRGLDSATVEAALDEVPDDELARALEFALTRLARVERLDHETALRRLHGQLARRGFPSSVAMNAARTALAERSGGQGVRFR